MSSSRARVLVLVVALLVVAGLVVADRVRKSGRDGTESAVPAAMSGYLDVAAQAARERALVEEADAWARLRGEAGAAWATLRGTVIEADTSQIALAEFRRRVQEEAASYDVELEGQARSQSAAVEDVAGVFELESVFTFKADDPRDLYAFLDRLEHLPELRTVIETLELSGPGTKEASTLVRAVVTLKAIAVTPEATAMLANESEGGGA